MLQAGSKMWCKGKHVKCKHVKCHVLVHQKYDKWSCVTTLNGINLVLSAVRTLHRILYIVSVSRKCIVFGV